MIAKIKAGVDKVRSWRKAATRKVCSWSPLRLGYAVLITVFAAVLAWYAFDTRQEWRDFSGGLLTELIGIIFTVLLIDKAVQAHEARLQAKAELPAVEALTRPMGQHLGFLIELNKATTEARRDKHPPLQVLFDDDFYANAAMLDLSANAPISPPRDWYTHGVDRFSAYKRGLDDVLQRFGSVMTPELVSLLAKATEPTFIDFFRNMGGLVRAGQLSPFFMAARNDDGTM